MPSSVGLSFRIQAKRTIFSSTNPQHCPHHNTVQIQRQGLTLGPLLSTLRQFLHYSCLYSGSTFSLKHGIKSCTLEQCYNISSSIAAHSWNSCQPPFSLPAPQTQSVKPCPALRLEGFSMGHSAGIHHMRTDINSGNSSLEIELALFSLLLKQYTLLLVDYTKGM